MAEGVQIMQLIRNINALPPAIDVSTKASTMRAVHWPQDHSFLIKMEAEEPEE